MQRRLQDDGFVHVEFFVEVETVTILDGVSHAAGGLASLENLTGHFIVDFGAARKSVVQIAEVAHGLQLSSVHVEVVMVNVATTNFF
nr:unnamed protein product [Spirometra erinaceieuropaei]